MKRKAYDGIYNQYIKRGIDFCLALVGLIIAAIPMARNLCIFFRNSMSSKGSSYIFE